MPIIRATDIIKNNYRLSPSNYLDFEIKNVKMKELEHFVQEIDRGTEIGSQNYVNESNYHFLRTSAFDENVFSLKIDNNSLIDITPNIFIPKTLNIGDVLICKDSNIGEVAILDQEFPNTMFSAGINRIQFKENSKYLYAVMKNKYFKKQLESLIPKGSTLKHAKNLYLKCKVPEPADEKQCKYIEKIVDIIMHKELLIKQKKKLIDKYIYEEINNNQIITKFMYKYPTINELQKVNRLDTGSYTEEFKEIDFKIRNYKNGFYTIDENNIKAGNTPKMRTIKEDKSLKYVWVTPTYINDDGTLLNNYSINCEKNNINQNCALIINRTSKGGQGEYVGIASYYDYELLGKAQHNQGIYRVSNYSDEELIFITCMLNCPYYRKYCANLSMGAKMKELKLKNIIEIPFPKFDTKSKQYVCNLYYNKLPKETKTDELQFVKGNYEWDENAGILDLFYSVAEAKQHLNSLINCLYNGRELRTDYRIY